MTEVTGAYPVLKLNQVAPHLFSKEVAVFLICYCHRMASTGPLATTEYFNELCERATALLKVYPYYATPDDVKNIVTVGHDVGKDFVASKSCSMLAVAYDMFFRTIEHQKHSSITMSALQSFCRGYTVFVDLKYMTDLTGMQFSEWAQWVWLPEIHGEMHRLAKNVRLRKMRKSYFPYLRSMSIISRSPLAVTVSPHLHTFVHKCLATVGSLTIISRFRAHHF